MVFFCPVIFFHMNMRLNEWNLNIIFVFIKKV